MGKLCVEDRIWKKQYI